jgi:hypothetical protein
MAFGEKVYRSQRPGASTSPSVISFLPSQASVVHLPNPNPSFLASFEEQKYLAVILSDDRYIGRDHIFFLNCLFSWY